MKLLTPAQYAANCNRERSAEAIEQTASKLRGRKQSPELIQKRVESRRGYVPSKETRKLWSQQRKGKKQTPAQYAANCNRERRYKQVKCINTGKIYKNAEEAAKDLNVSKTGVVSVCNGGRKHCKNHYFTYEDI